MADETKLTIDDFKLQTVKGLPATGRKMKVVGVDGHPVMVRVFPMEGIWRSKLIDTVHAIYTRIIEPNAFEMTKARFILAANFVGFALVRGHADKVGAMTLADQPIIMFNESSPMWGETKKLHIAVLHELVHALYRMNGEEFSAEEMRADSKYEAAHDLVCYSVLGYPVRSDHWAFRKYPEFKKPEGE